MSKFKVGDKVRLVSNRLASENEVGDTGTVKEVNFKGDCRVQVKGGPVCLNWSYESDLELVEEFKPKSSQDAPVSGGPSVYYDYPFDQWVTGNDMMEHFATEVWGSYSLHFKDIFKAGLRWGNKSGTTEEYDARKIVYSGLRLLGMVAGKQAVADYLKELSEDQQFLNSGTDKAITESRKGGVRGFTTLGDIMKELGEN